LFGLPNSRTSIVSSVQHIFNDGNRAVDVTRAMKSQRGPAEQRQSFFRRRVEKLVHGQRGLESPEPGGGRLDPIVAVLQPAGVAVQDVSSDSLLDAGLSADTGQIQSAFTIDVARAVDPSLDPECKPGQPFLLNGKVYVSIAEELWCIES
jgi:hypothetical protein